MTQETRGKKYNKRFRWCCIGLQGIVLFGFTCILYKAFKLQVLEHKRWYNKARNQSEATIRVPISRGSIYDRNGRLLAVSVKQFSVFARPNQIVDPADVAQALAPVLGDPVRRIKRILDSPLGFVWVKRAISDWQAVQIAKLKLRGIFLIPEYHRFYPYQSLGGQVLGFVGVDGEGLEGIEKAYNDFLEGGEIELGQTRDGGKRLIWQKSGFLSNPVERAALYLSLDVYLQFVTERALARAIRRYDARCGEVVVLDTRSFEVLALANWPSFDPNRYRSCTPDMWRNRAITDSFEPGSALKVFLFGAALEEGIITPGGRLFCEEGRFTLAGHTIHDLHPHGWLTVPEILKFSSNIGAAKIAISLGSRRFFGYLRRAGFGRRTGIDLPGESSGILRPWRVWHLIDLASSGFGQGIGVTAMQLTVAMAAVANGGVWKRPVIVKEIKEGISVRKHLIQNSHRVFTHRTTALLTRLLTGVTEPGGTGAKAALDGYFVAGKTGTAQVIDPRTGRYATRRFTSIFTGFVPADEPRLAITVVIHDPKKAIYGGVVAAPVFREIASRALPYLGVKPRAPENNPGFARYARYER